VKKAESGLLIPRKLAANVGLLTVRGLLKIP